MKRQPKRSEQPPWVMLAEEYDHHLTSDDPMWMHAGPYDSAPTPLEVHVHQGMDVGIMLEGRLELQYGDVVSSPQPGDVWLGAMWEPHAWRWTTHRQDSVSWTFLTEVLAEHPVDDISYLRMFSVPPSQRPRVTSENMRENKLSGLPARWGWSFESAGQGGDQPYGCACFVSWQQSDVSGCRLRLRGEAPARTPASLPG